MTELRIRFWLGSTRTLSCNSFPVDTWFKNQGHITPFTGASVGRNCGLQTYKDPSCPGNADLRINNIFFRFKKWWQIMDYLQTLHSCIKIHKCQRIQFFCDDFLRYSRKYGLGSLRKTPTEVPQADNWSSAYEKPTNRFFCESEIIDS